MDIQFKVKDGEVPEVFVDGKSFGVVALSYVYVTRAGAGAGMRMLVATVLTGDDDVQHVLSYNEATGEKFYQ